MTRYAKALAALLGAVGTWGYSAADDERIALSEWFGLLPALATAIAVFAIPNRPPADEPHDPTISEQDPRAVPDAGASDAGLIVVALIVLVIVLVLLGRL